MKKNLLFLVLTICASFTLSAQVTISPSPVSVDGITATDTDVAAHSTMTNNATEDRTYLWEREVISMTDGWESAVCDKNNCYFPGVGSKEVTLAADEEGTMDIHVYPNGNEGSAIIKMTFTDTADTTITETNMYYFNADPSSVNGVQVEKISMYPNPTHGLFSLTTNNAIKELVIYNLAGSPVKRFETDGNRYFDIADLPRGNYLVRMIGKEGTTLITRLLQKL